MNFMCWVRECERVYNFTKKRIFFFSFFKPLMKNNPKLWLWSSPWSWLLIHKMHWKFLFTFHECFKRKFILLGKRFFCGFSFHFVYILFSFSHFPLLLSFYLLKTRKIKSKKSIYPSEQVDWLNLNILIIMFSSEA